MMRRGGSALATIAVLLAAAWLGAVALFGAVVAPAAFAVLPSRALAGALVGRVLPVLFVAGMIVGAVVIAAAWQVGVRRGALIAGAAILLACAGAHFVIGGQIERIRASLPAALDELPASDPVRVTFGRLHGLSVAGLGLAAAAAAASIALLVRGPRNGARA